MENGIAKYIKKCRPNNLLSSLSFLAFFPIIVILIILISTAPADKYEMSIYDAYPNYFWYLLMFSIFFGMITIIKCFLKNDYSIDNKFLFTGYFSIAMANAILLLMPLIRGYTIFGRADVLAHIGFIKDILHSGHLGSNYYPSIHIIAADLSLISTIDIPLQIALIPALFWTFAIVSFYLLFNRISRDRLESFLMLAPVLIPIIGIVPPGYGFFPFFLSFCTLPLLLHLFFKSRLSQKRIEFTFLILIFIIFNVFLHPLTLILIVLILLGMEFSLKMVTRFKLLNVSKIEHSYTLILISSIILLMWNYSIYLFISENLRQIWFFLVGNDTDSQYTIISNMTSSYNVSPVDLIKLIINLYGQTIFIILISTFCLLYIYKKNIRSYYLFISISEFLLAMITSFIVFLFLYSISFNRIYIASIPFSLILIGFVSYNILKAKDSNKLARNLILSLLILVLILTLYFSVFNLYPYPTIKKINQQVSRGELAGMETFFNSRNESLLILSLGITQLEFHNAIFGRMANRKDILFGRETSPADHFGYMNYTSFSHVYKTSRYFILTTPGKDFYRFIFPEYKEFWRYTEDDFDRLNDDSGVDLIYSNGDLTTYLI